LRISYPQPAIIGVSQSHQTHRALLTPRYAHALLPRFSRIIVRALRSPGASSRGVYLTERGAAPARCFASIVRDAPGRRPPLLRGVAFSGRTRPDERGRNPAGSWGESSCPAEFAWSRGERKRRSSQACADCVNLSAVERRRALCVFALPTMREPHTACASKRRHACSRAVRTNRCVLRRSAPLGFGFSGTTPRTPGEKRRRTTRPRR
jgi:hypothetical protein